MDVLVLSPHRDDAAFSCGLLLAALVEARTSVCVVNVCTESDYAPYADAVGAAAITVLRAQEDVAFNESLCTEAGAHGAVVQWIDLCWKDAPLRLRIETGDVLSGRDVAESEVMQLAAELRTLPAAHIVLSPLALGGHLDHRLVRCAAQRCFRDALTFYEDLPYATSIAPSERGHAVPELSAWMSPAARAGLKREFANCYGSQIADDIARAMEQYGAALGHRERIYGSAETLQRISSWLDDAPPEIVA